MNQQNCKQGSDAHILRNSAEIPSGTIALLVLTVRRVLQDFISLVLYMFCSSIPASFLRGVKFRRMELLHLLYHG